MAVHRQRDGASVDGEPTIAVHGTSPDRAVFTESGNPDGWIATDLTLRLER